MTSPIAVLGTGRMGAAMAARLAAHHPVVTWSRSGRVVPGIPSAPTAAAAVDGARVVLLALFDAAACVEVVDPRGAVTPGTTVVNTATVGPDEADALADRVRRAGLRYLHAAVIGSLPAVRAGRLTLLTGAHDPVDPAPRKVLELLGDPIDAGTPAAAAALKLVANGVLADCLLAVRDALGRADDLGVDRGSAVAVLQRTTLGGLVSAKRDRLTDPAAPADAEFTVAALAKDLGLLDRAVGRAHRATPLLTAIPGGARDIAAVCTAPSVVAPAHLADARLTVGAEVDCPPELLAPLHSYALGHATGSVAHFRQAFRDTAHVEGIRDGALCSWDLDAYCALFDGPAPDESRRRRVLEAVDVRGSVATARMSLAHGEDHFTDVFLLIRDDDGWRIANKAYHRA